MPSRKGSPNKNKAFLINRLKEMYGDDFDPIMMAAEQAVRLHAAAIDDENAIQSLKTSVDAWLKIGEYVTPKLKALELSQDPDNPLFEKDENARFSELNRLQEIISRRSGETDRTETGGTEIH